MKKNIFCIIITLLCYNLHGIDLKEQYQCNLCYYAIDNNINIRKEPNTQSQILGQLFEGEEIFVNVQNSSAEWFFCYIPKINKTGYCSVQYFKCKQYFSDVIDKLIENDLSTIDMVRKGYVYPINLDTLISEYLMDLDEKTCLQIIKLAYDSGYNTESSDSTVLIEASKLNYFSIINYLIEKKEYKSEINIKKNQFAQPLYFALWNGNEKISELLLKNGANPNNVTVYFDTMFESIDFAIQNNAITMHKGEKLKQLLLKYGYKE